MIGDQERRIAREAAAVHSVERLTAKEEDGGLPLPWEQSLPRRGVALSAGGQHVLRTVLPHHSAQR